MSKDRKKIWREDEYPILLSDDEHRLLDAHTMECCLSHRVMNTYPFCQKISLVAHWQYARCHDISMVVLHNSRMEIIGIGHAVRSKHDRMNERIARQICLSRALRNVQLPKAIAPKKDIP